MVGFQPQSWQPPAAPDLTGELAGNDRLAKARLLEVGTEGPEDVVLDDEGVAYTGTADGLIRTIDRAGKIETFAEPGGRPLGVEWHGEDLLVCNADLGLQLVSPRGTVKTLVEEFEGHRLLFTNNAAVASDGTVYFTDSSTRWGIHEYVNDLVEGQLTGRLFKRTPAGEVEVCTGGLQFANGVALDPKEESVFVAETGRYRVHRHWLKGPRAGNTEVFVDNMPGFPDNLTFGNDTLWVALASPRQRMVDFMAARNWLRHVTYRLPESLKPKPVRHGFVLGYDVDGRVVHNLQDQSGRVAITTSARFHDGSLYVGSLSEPHVAVLDLG